MHVTCMPMQSIKTMGSVQGTQWAMPKAHSTNVKGTPNDLNMHCQMHIQRAQRASRNPAAQHAMHEVELHDFVANMLLAKPA